MEYSATAKATEYLANFPNAVLPNDQFEMVECRSRGVPAVVTSYELYTTKNLTLKLKPINSLGQRGLILRFYDYLIPRPFSQLEALEATFLAPEFKKYEILEAPDNDTCIVLNCCDDWPTDFGYDWMPTHMITVQWKVSGKAED